MPTGKVKWYDPDKGFGFLSQEGGEDVYVRSSALPTGVEALKAGQRVEFGIASGRRGPQALSLRLIEPRCPGRSSAKASPVPAARLIGGCPISWEPASIRCSPGWPGWRPSAAARKQQESSGHPKPGYGTARTSRSEAIPGRRQCLLRRRPPTRIIGC